MAFKILFVASECTPLAKVGGLGDVIGALPKALSDLGVDVRIVLPKYGIIDYEKYPAKLLTTGVKVADENIDIYQATLPKSSIPVYLLDNERFFRENGIYFSETAFVGSSKEIERFLFFSKAVLEIFGPLGWTPDIIHCNDWQASTIPLLLKIKNENKKLKTLLTIHSLPNQGRWNAREILDFLGLAQSQSGSLKEIDAAGNLVILEQGILNADILTTVSPNYRKEILTKEYGAGLEKSLLKRKKNLFGILNGMDTDVFNPQTDRNIKANYSLNDIAKKIKNKTDLQRAVGLPQDERIPLLGLVSRLTDQKGVDLVAGIIPELVKTGVQFVALGVGAKEYERALEDLAEKYPKNVSANIKFDAPLGQKIYAGADIFLMPSKYEPCGLGQLIAMRYGTVPIVRKTGGLADTVSDGKTGFVFKEYGSQAFLSSIKLALEKFRDKAAWKKMQKKVMAQDFSWQKSAKEYLKLYKKMVYRH